MYWHKSDLLLLIYAQHWYIFMSFPGLGVLPGTSVWLEALITVLAIHTHTALTGDTWLPIHISLDLSGFMDSLAAYMTVCVLPGISLSLSLSLSLSAK